MIPLWPDCMQRKSASIWGIHVLNLKSLADQSINNNNRADNKFSFLTREHQQAIITITADNRGLRSARIVACTIVMSPSDLPFSRTRKLFPIESCSLQSVLDFEIVWLDKIQTLTYQLYFAVDSAVGRVRSGVARNYALRHKFFTKKRSLDSPGLPRHWSIGVFLQNKRQSVGNDDQAAFGWSVCGGDRDLALEALIVRHSCNFYSTLIVFLTQKRF